MAAFVHFKNLAYQHRALVVWALIIGCDEAVFRRHVMCVECLRLSVGVVNIPVVHIILRGQHRADPLNAAAASSAAWVLLSFSLAFVCDFVVAMTSHLQLGFVDVGLVLKRITWVVPPMSNARHGTLKRSPVDA